MQPGGNEYHMSNENKPVTASDIAACGYCAYKLYLQKNKGISNQTAQRFKQGDTAHKQYNKQFRSGNAVRLALVLALVLLLLWLGHWA